MTKRGRGAERGGKEGHKMAGGIPDKSCICVMGNKCYHYTRPFFITKALSRNIAKGSMDPGVDCFDQ